MERCCRKSWQARSYTVLYTFCETLIHSHSGYPLMPRPVVTYQNRTKKVTPINATTPLLICECEAAPGNDTIIAELVGLAAGEVDVEVPFPVTLRFTHICLTRVPNAVSHINQYSTSNSVRKEAHFLNQKMNKSKSSVGTERRWIVTGSCARSDIYNRFLRSLWRLLLRCHRES